MLSIVPDFDSLIASVIKTQESCSFLAKVYHKGFNNLKKYLNSGILSYCNSSRQFSVELHSYLVFVLVQLIACLHRDRHTRRVSRTRAAV